jgi:hypothetical protein
LNKELDLLCAAEVALVFFAKNYPDGIPLTYLKSESYLKTQLPKVVIVLSDEEAENKECYSLLSAAIQKGLKISLDLVKVLKESELKNYIWSEHTVAICLHGKIELPKNSLSALTILCPSITSVINNGIKKREYWNSFTTTIRNLI